MIPMKIDSFSVDQNKYYKLTVKPQAGEDDIAKDLLYKQIQKFVSENQGMRYNIYSCSRNEYIKIIEFYQ